MTRTIKSLIVFTVLAACALAQTPVPGVDYPSPIPVPFIGFTKGTSNPTLCVPGFSPFHFRSDSTTYYYCSARNTWTAFRTTGGAQIFTTVTGTGFLPVTVGATTVGAAAKPFFKFYLGTADTNNFVFTPASTAAQRVITITDPGGAATMAWLNPTTVQTLSGTVVNAAASSTARASANLASGTAPTTSVAGDLWLDSTKKAITVAPVATAVEYLSGSLYNSATPITATNPSTIADLMAFTLPAGVLSRTGKQLRVCGGGTYTTASGQTPTFTLTYAMAGVAPLAIVSAATTASATTMPWDSCATFTTVTAGASGTVEAGGRFSMVLVTTAAAAAATYLGTNTAVSSAFDQTATVALKMRATMSSSDAGNSVVQRWISVELLN